jgi:uncharacterized Zn finger protein
MSGPETFQFRVQGSAAEPYVVSFRRRGGNNISATCTCPAAQIGMSCKHRMDILRGRVECIVSPNAADVATVAGWFAGSDVQTALDTIERLEKEAEAIQTALTAAKKAFADRLLD